MLIMEKVGIEMYMYIKNQFSIMIIMRTTVFVVLYHHRCSTLHCLMLTLSELSFWLGIISSNTISFLYVGSSDVLIPISLALLIKERAPPFSVAGGNIVSSGICESTVTSSPAPSRGGARGGG